MVVGGGGWGWVAGWVAGWVGHGAKGKALGLGATCVTRVRAGITCSTAIGSVWLWRRTWPGPHACLPEIPITTHPPPSTPHTGRRAVRWQHLG